MLASLTAMTVLKNTRHELFAQEVVRAKAERRTMGTAYTRAGYTSVGHVAEVAASRMLNDHKNGVQERVFELLRRGATRAEKRLEITVDSLLDKLELNIVKATKAGQFSAVNGSVGLMSQLRGLLVNRLEVASAGGFDSSMSVEDVVNRVRDTEGDDAADWLAIIVETDKHEQLAMLDRMRDRITNDLADHAHDVGVSVGIEPLAITEREQDQ